MSGAHKSAIQFGLWKIVTAKKDEASGVFVKQNFFPREAFNVVAGFTGGTKKDSPMHYEWVKADEHFASALLTADCALGCALHALCVTQCL